MDPVVPVPSASSLGRTTEDALWTVHGPGTWYLESSVPPDSPSGITINVLVIRSLSGQNSVGRPPDSRHTVN